MRLEALLTRALPWLVLLFLGGLMLSAVWARNLALLMVLGGLVAGMLPGRFLDRMDRQFMLLMAILPVAYVGNMLALGWNERFLERPAHLLAAIPVYWLVRRGGLSREVLLIGLALAGLIAGTIAALASAGVGGSTLLALQTGRPLGVFSSPGPFGNYSAVAAMVILVGLVAWSPPVHARALSLFCVTGAAGGLVAALLSETRSAWVALPVMALLVEQQGLARRRKAWLAASLVLMAVAGLAASDFVRERLMLALAEVQAYQADPASPAARETSIGLRLLSWQWGWEQFLAHPLMGIGLANFRTVVAAAVAAGTLPPVLATFSGLHNLLIDHLTMTGLVGTLVLVAFWWGLSAHFLALRRHGSPEGRLFATWGLMLVAAEFLFASLGSMFASSLGTLVFCVLLAILAAGAHPQTPLRG